MKDLPPNVCEICQKPLAGKGHPVCSKIKQQKHIDDKRPHKVRKHSPLRQKTLGDMIKIKTS